MCSTVCVKNGPSNRFIRRSDASSILLVLLYYKGNGYTLSNGQHLSISNQFRTTGDQPEAIEKLCAGLSKHRKLQTSKGVTGSGKTFTAANTIARHTRPTLVLSHNKTLVAQLYAEPKPFFSNNSAQYFVSYYDYYQPEAYIPQTDTFIEKDSSINKRSSVCVWPPQIPR